MKQCILHLLPLMFSFLLYYGQEASQLLDVAHKSLNRVLVIARQGEGPYRYTPQSGCKGALSLTP